MRELMLCERLRTSMLEEMEWNRETWKELLEKV